MMIVEMQCCLILLLHSLYVAISTLWCLHQVHPTKQILSLYIRFSLLPLFVFPCSLLLPYYMLMDVFTFLFCLYFVCCQFNPPVVLKSLLLMIHLFHQ